jgi:hypothetical protein
MNAVWMRARAQLRARARAVLGLALVIGVTGGVVVAAAVGARRTENALPAFRKATNAAQLGIANAGDLFGFANVDFAKIASFPEVTDSAEFNFIIGFVDGPRDIHLTPAGDQDPVVIFGGADPRFDTVINRMRIVEGRAPNQDASDEVAVSYVAAMNYGIRVDDILTFRFPTFEDLGEMPITPSGPVRRAKVVAIEAVSWELPPGSGYPAIHITSAFKRTLTEGPQFPAAVFTLRTDDDVAAVVDRVQREAVLPDRDNPTTRVQTFLETDNARGIQQAEHVQAVAMWLLALLVGVSSMIVIVQAVVRQMSIETAEEPLLGALGMTPSQRVAVAAIRLGMTAMAGTLIAFVVMLALSPLTPVGLARVLDAHDGLYVDAPAAVIGLTGLMVVVVSAGIVPAIRTAHQSSGARAAIDARRAPSRVVDALSRASLSPTAVTGVRMAMETGHGPTAVPARSTMFGAMVGVMAVVVGLTFGASLTHLLRTPTLTGWNWSGKIGDDFDADSFDIVAPTLAAEQDVEAYSYGSSGTIQLGGKPFDVVGMNPVRGSIGPVVLEGRAPVEDDELALDRRAVRAAHARVGDVVAVRTGAITREMTVVGRIVTASVTPQDVSGLGGWMTFDALRVLQPNVVRDLFLYNVDKRADPVAVRERLKRGVGEIAVESDPEPGFVSTFGRVINLPVVLALLLALLAAATLAHTLITSARRRARELAVLATLGFVRRQVRATLAWHATTVVVVALTLGIPVGIIAGRWSWTLFASRIGVVAEPIVPALSVGSVIPSAVLVAIVVSMVPGQIAARSRPALALRAVD